MILIECFTESHIDNMASCLRLRPEVMILVGNMLQMGKPIKRYEQILRLRKQRTKIRPCDIHKKDFTEIYNALAQIVAQDEEYIIDMTGGDETVIMAVGALIAGLGEEKRQHVHVQTYDHQKGMVYDNIHDNLSYPSGDVSLTVEQLILLHGGKLHPEAYQPGAECRINAMADLWQIVTEDPKRWNRSVTLLNEFESRSGLGMEICLHLGQIRDGISKFEEKLPVVQALLKKMEKNGVIDIVSWEGTLEYTYRSSLLRYCMLKAGNVLEVKTLLEGRGVLKNGMYPPIAVHNDYNKSIYAGKYAVNNNTIKTVADNSTDWKNYSLPEGFNIIDLQLAESNRSPCPGWFAYSKNKSPKYALGGTKIAEYLVFPITLTNSVRQDIYTALRTKWFGEAKSVQRFGNLSVGTGAKLVLPWKDVSVTNCLTALGGELEVAKIGTKTLSLQSASAKITGELTIEDGATVTVSHLGDMAFASIEAQKLVLAGGGKVVLVDDGRTRFRSVKVPIVKGGDFVRGSGTWTLDASAIKGAARLLMEEDGIYADISPLGMPIIVR